MKTILITSVGSLVGQNVLDALENRRQHLRIVGTNLDADALGNFRCDTVYLVNPVTQREAYISDLIRLINHITPDVIIPGRDPDIELLGHLREQYYPESPSFLCGNPDFAVIMSDKVLSWQFAQSRKLPFAPVVESGQPDSLQLARELINIHGFPLIAKPRYGSGSLGILLVVQPEQLERVVTLDGYAIQPYIGNVADCTLDTSYGLPFFWEVPEESLYVAQVLISKQGEILETCQFVSKMVMGKCVGMSLVSDPLLATIARQYADAAIEAGWVGLLNIQMKKKEDGSYTGIEMNGRFSGGTSGRRFFGFDEVRTILNAWVGEDCIPPFPLQTPYSSIIRQAVDIPIPEADIHSLHTNRRWDATGSGQSLGNQIHSTP